jgi:hypothetical protein
MEATTLKNLRADGKSLSGRNLKERPKKYLIEKY